jgi:hypothetical protein
LGLHQPLSSYEVRFPVEEADGYAYEPRHPIGEPMDQYTGVGTGELREPVPCTSVNSGPSDDLDGEMLGIASLDRLDGLMMVAQGSRFGICLSAARSGPA